jgi:NAD(P)H-hydrate epimerase
MLAKDFLSTHNIKSSIVLTPHPGEAADLLGITIKEVQLDRVNAAKKIATQYKATVILKGAGSIVTDGSEVYICDEGGPELATGGTGDILAGLVGSLIAQGLSANNASLLAVATHGLAGKEFKDICGENGLAASELIPLIRKILNNK